MPVFAKISCLEMAADILPAIFCVELLNGSHRMEWSTTVPWSSLYVDPPWLYPGFGCPPPWGPLGTSRWCCCCSYGGHVKLLTILKSCLTFSTGTAQTKSNHHSMRDWKGMNSPYLPFCGWESDFWEVKPRIVLVECPFFPTFQKLVINSWC